jgi:membrane protein YdbS with pleckstrin-like domain
VTGQPFGPPDGGQWKRVSSRMRDMRRTGLLVAGIPAVIIAALILSGISSMAAAAICVVGVVGLILGYWAIGRNWMSWGYAERAQDLLVTRGVLFQKLVVVPYGRMQLVDVEAGPIERLFGITKVKLHTAAATTDAEIIGLLPHEAFALRDRLAALGESHAPGL